MLQIVTAIEHDGFNSRIMNLKFEHPDDKNYGLLKNIERVCTEYINNQKG